MIETEDRYIIQKCLDGETEAFGFLVDRYRESVYALAYSKLHNRHDAEDITQKVFIKAYQKLRTLKQWDNMHAWLYSITANMCKDWIKIQSRRPDRSFIEDQDPKTIESITTDSQDDPMIETLNEALESLPEIYRQVLTLYYLGDKDNKEIANFLGISPESVRQRLTRARSLLKEEITAMMGKTFETQRLPVGFTFRIIEAVKRIKIDPVSIGKGVPWGLSLATGLLVTILSLNPQFMKMAQIDLTNLAVSGESSVLETGDFSVDIAKISENPFLANQEGANNGKSVSDNPLIQNAFLLAPKGEGGTWTKKADMPTARSGMVSAEVNGKIYVFSGGSSVFAGVKSVEEYDIAKDKWTQKKDMSEVIGFATACSLNGKIYIIGGVYPGGTVLNQVKEYDPITETWTQKASISPRFGLSACVLNGKIYAIGGSNSFSFFSIVEEYDPATDKWIRKSDMQVPRTGLATAVVNGKIYAIGGEVGTSLATVEEYDPIKDSWKTKTSMPTARVYPSCVEIDGKIYVMGGCRPNNQNLLATSVVEVYDPATDTWEKKADMLTARALFCTRAVNGVIYAIGGSDQYIGWVNPSANVYSTVEAYDTGTFKQPSSVSPKGKLPTKWGEAKK
jgi:RNA polymerase sigma factor (sigma-70 family)